MHLHQYDLNLLIVFDHIFRERHLTKAGEQLNLSQPAMSKALGRLRDVFQDPLFVRSGKEMLPTACAERIAPQIQQVLHLTERTFLDRGDFDSSTSTRTFRMAMSDYTEMVLMPRLFKRLQTVAPHVRIQSEHLAHFNYREQLDNNSLDMILACGLDFGPNVLQQSIFQDREVIMLRADSPVLQEELTVKRYADLKHAQFRWFFEDYPIDIALEKLNLKRNVVLEVQHELVLPLVLKDNDLLVNMPERMALLFKDLLPLEIIPLPLSRINYNFRQYWHERNHHDPAHTWLRNEIKSVAEEL